MKQELPKKPPPIIEPHSSCADLENDFELFIKLWIYSLTPCSCITRKRSYNELWQSNIILSIIHSRFIFYFLKKYPNVASDQIKFRLRGVQSYFDKCKNPVHSFYKLKVA